MEILEQRDQWKATFRSGWLAHYQAHGEIDWSLYSRPNNKQAPAGPAIDPANSRILFISSAGGYLSDSQEPFDAPHPLGDYTIRVFPANTPFDHIAYAHTHYDHTARIADPQVLMPLQHLAELVKEGVLGSVADNMISFMGYQPDISRVVDETIPAILEAARDSNADGALVVPA